MKRQVVIFVTGDRGWTNADIIDATLKGFPVGSWLVQGGCRGADLLAQASGNAYGYQPIRMDALWALHGAPAGPIRNREMGDLLAVLRYGGAEIHAFVFHDHLDTSKGTKDMVKVLATHEIEWKHVTTAKVPA